MKKAIDPTVSVLISELERLLRKLKERLKEETQNPAPHEKPQIVASAFGRRTCANRPLRSSTAPAAPVIDPNLGSL